MMIKRQNGNMLVHLGPTVQACPGELIQQRRGHNGCTEYLIRWNILSLENDIGNSVESCSAESKTQTILMWMSAEDVNVNCPMLLGKRKPREQVLEANLSNTFPPEGMSDEASLLEMKADVRNLVQRASWQMASTTVPPSSLLNTIHILSTYASIGSLVNTFRDIEFLNLLTKMLCHEEKQIRYSAGKMLKALASHDAGSQAYVLLSLSEQSGIEQHMDSDNCYTLLELLAETTSCEEHCISLEGIPLPQIPGKLLFSLVKCYLCATSLLDKLNNVTEWEEQQKHSMSSSEDPGRRSRIHCQFDFSMAMANLISELIQAMGWNQNKETQLLRQRKPRVKSIFQAQIPSCATMPSSVQLPHKENSAFKLRSAFPSRNSYVEYVQETLVCGMHVRMLEDYEKVVTGDEGEFLQSNNGTPPVQVYWESLGRTYWVHWHMIEIIGSSSRAEQRAQEKLSSLRESLRQNTVNQARYHKPLQRLYSLPCFMGQMNKKCGTLSQAEWWELLFFIKKLELHKQQKVVQFIQENQKLSRLNEEDLIQMSVSVELAQKILQLLNKLYQGTTQTDLQNSLVYFKYFFNKGDTERSCQNVDMFSTSCGDLSAVMMSRKPKEDLLSDRVSSPTPFAAGGCDTQLINKLLRMEGLFFPDTLDEKAKAFYSVKVGEKNSILEQLVDAMEIIQKSSYDTELQMAGLRFITKILEEEEEPGQEIIKAECEFTIREKIVKVLVDLLSHHGKETLLTVLVLQILYVLLAKYDCQIIFVTKDGLHSVLHCMKENSTSVLVQQAGLAVLKVLLSSENYKLSSASRRFCPLDNSVFQAVQEILVNLGSASSKDTDNLLSVIPDAVEKMLGIPGASASVQDGLLVLSKLIDHNKALAEQLGNCGLHCTFQNFFHLDQSSNRMLAQKMLTHLSDHKLPLSHHNSDAAATFNLPDIDVTKLLNSLHAYSDWKEIAVVLQHCLCNKGYQNVGDTKNDLLTAVLILKDMTEQETEKSLQLGIVRLLNTCLDSSWKDEIPWHKCIEPCLSSINSHISDLEIVQQFTKFLLRLASVNKECASAMCCSSTKEALTNILEKHSDRLPQVTELRDLMSNYEKQASLYKRMTANILAGCIQMVLGQIEEHRHSLQPISVPYFDVFLHYLCQGCSIEAKEHKYWERIEVSSNSQQASKLVDGNLKTYWESNGIAGSHYISVYMRHGVIIQQMSLLVASEDSSYMPAQIIVMGGESTSCISAKLNMVNVPALSTRVTLLENMPRFWPIIQIKIKRCQQDGIDTRVHGIEVLGPMSPFGPIFREQLCRRTSLFYTTKAQTWCQGISEDQTQLLQLFSRLNSALCHEQVFASCFLHDEEDARTLGKTCWEALITPLVQSITSPDPNGVSPMSWLLSQYLENWVAAQNAVSQAVIFSSRVRHLSHLLVHADSDSPEPKELTSPVKFNRKRVKNKELRSGAVKPAMKKPTSITGIAQCWKDVVQQQVEQFLKSSWQVPDFVEQYCSTYQHLHAATEELFGQKTSFMQALCHGFTGSLLQLPFLTVVHVCEQFAHYIDRWIQESWADSASRETLQCLQQKLEPILFLADLELANIFEHFYRYYLGERLLSRGNTWLESAVVEHIGLCFPSRFPQQMLKNLSELEEQQQEFHLFQLHQLDKHLLGADQCGKHKPEGELLLPRVSHCPPKATTQILGLLSSQKMQEKPFSQEQEAEVKVLVVSPRCWTISPLCHLEEPASFFPSLNLCLSNFADFYTQRQHCVGLESAKPPSLQWTWLGHAELEYQGCVLRVSTLQMYILLCFNDAEEVSVETLLEATGLSPVFLGHALNPLTKRNGILTRKQSILRLNEETQAQVSGQRLWLLPKRMYLDMEEKEGPDLERKRNFICCLLIQILKEEKEMHIDNLVLKVIDASHKQKCSASNILSNACSSADVLSCILHLINQGFVQRQKDFPQLLQYISVDIPTTVLPKSEPQVVFQTVQIKKSPVYSMSCAEKKQTFSTFR